MADLDTAAKRFSGMCWGDMLPVLPIVDGAVDTEDRLHYLELYSGIAAAAPADSGDTKSSGRSGTHRKNTVRSSTYRSGTTR